MTATVPAGAGRVGIGGLLWASTVGGVGVLFYAGFISPALPKAVTGFRFFGGFTVDHILTAAAAMISGGLGLALRRAVMS